MHYDNYAVKCIYGRRARVRQRPAIRSSSIAQYLNDRALEGPGVNTTLTSSRLLLLHPLADGRYNLFRYPTTAP